MFSLRFLKPSFASSHMLCTFAIHLGYQHSPENGPPSSTTRPGHIQARAGTDALAAHVRAALATRRDAVLVSLDGRSAYDSMSRAAPLGKLHEVAPELLPFVWMFYGRPSTYCWWDANGCCRDIQQGVGCEQRDAFAPARPVRARATRRASPSRSRPAP